MILFLFVIFCAWKFPPNLSQSPHPKTMAPRCLLAQQLRPSKGVQSSCSEVTPWHMIWNSTMAKNAGIDFLYPKSGRWKPPIFCAQKDHGPVCQRRLLLTHSVGCKNWSGSKSPQCGEKCWVLGPRTDRTRYGSTQSAFIYSRNHGMPLVHWSTIVTSLHRPPQKPKRFRVEMAIEVISSCTFYTWIIPISTSPAAWAG